MLTGAFRELKRSVLVKNRRQQVMKKTKECTKKNRNGIKRLVFSALAVFFQVIFILCLFTRLNRYAAAINTVTSILAFVLVLTIYGKEQTASIKAPWIILILAFPVMGVTIYLLVGLNRVPSKMRTRFKEIDSKLLPCLPDDEIVRKRLEVISPQAAGISSYLSRNAFYPMYQQTDITYFKEASDGMDSQIKDMAKAEKYIFIEYHAIENKESWSRIQKVLEDRARAGVEVRIFYDDMGSIGYIDKDFPKKMETLGLKCRVFNPVAPVFNVFLNNRDHRKITVIDGKIAYTGGYNIANEYFNLTHPYGVWKDTGVRLEGDAVRSFTVMFLEMWNASERNLSEEINLKKYLTAYDGYTMKKGDFVQPYADSPLDNEQVGEEVYISMVNTARKYCWFMTPYLIITDKMSHALTLAAKRGVDVRIITPGIPDKKMVYRVTRSFYHQLAKYGVRIFEWTPGFCHAKISVADDIMATCGTINLDYRSLYHHFENGCFFADCDAVKDIKDDFDKCLKECVEVTEKYKVRSAGLRLGQLFMRLFAELL